MENKLSFKYVESTIRVVIIEDDSTIREGYAFLVNEHKDIHVVNSYASFEDARSSLRSDHPDIILLDIELPGISGADAIADIRKILPAVSIIMLTIYENENILFKCLGNGANGYLIKSAPASKIIDAIREVGEGGAPMSPIIAKKVISSFQRTLNSPLSKRETEILENISLGKSRTKIAQELFIDPETVKTHIKNIYNKLNVSSKEDALKIARQNKLIRQL